MNAISYRELGYEGGWGYPEWCVPADIANGRIVDEGEYWNRRHWHDNGWHKGWKHHHGDDDDE